MEAKDIRRRIARVTELRAGFTAELGRLGAGQDPLIALDRKDYADAMRDAIEAMDKARQVLERASTRLTS
jgi:hypothetical protein